MRRAADQRAILPSTIIGKTDMPPSLKINIPSAIYPKLEDLFLTLLAKSGFDLKITKKIDFAKLYKEKFG